MADKIKYIRSLNLEDFINEVEFKSREDNSELHVGSAIFELFRDMDSITVDSKTRITNIREIKTTKCLLRIVHSKYLTKFQYFIK